MDAIEHDIGQLIVGALIFFGLIKIYSWLQDAGEKNKWQTAGRCNDLSDQIEAAERRYKMLPPSSIESRKLAEAIKIDRAQLQRERKRLYSWWYRLFTNL